MRRRALLLGLWALGMAVAGCGGGGGAPGGPGGGGPGGGDRGVVLVRLQPGQDPAALAAELGVRDLGALDDSGIRRFELERPEERDDLLQRLRGDGRVDRADGDDDFVAPEVHGDPIHLPFDRRPQPGAFPTQPAFVQINLNGTRRTRPRPGAPSRSPGVVVAVLDTGVDPSHPLLSGRLNPGFNALDPTRPPDERLDGAHNRAYGHGTMIAGLIAHIAPDARILPVRVLDADGDGSTSSVLAGLRFALRNGARVVNMSFSTTVKSDLLEEALDEAEAAGVLIVAAAGNDGAETRHYPAAYSHVLSVAALDADDRKASFSSYGSHVRLSAPGLAIRSAFAGNEYATWSGTSFAAPLASAAAALLLHQEGALGPEDVVDRLCRTARPIDHLNPAYDGRLGSGLLDVAAALTPQND